MRILRIYKLFRHFAGLQALLYTLKQAYKELGLLLIIISSLTTTSQCKGRNPPRFIISGVAILSFSSLVYICENEIRDRVNSIIARIVIVLHCQTREFRFG